MIEFLTIFALTLVAVVVTASVAVAMFALSWKISDIAGKKFGEKAELTVFVVLMVFSMALIFTTLSMLGGAPQ